MAVHRELGPGKPEAAYVAALGRELALRGLPYQIQKPVPVVYKGVKLECGYRLDVLVANIVVVEANAVEVVIPVHRAQTLTYLKLGGWHLALLLNFQVATLKEGIERLVLGFQEPGIPLPAVEQRRKNGPARASAAPPFNITAHSGDGETERLATEIIASALEVHRELGPGLLPSAYAECLCHELHLRGIPFERRKPLALTYKGILLPESDQVEMLVGGQVVVNPRALVDIRPVHEAQLLSQLRLGAWRLGLLINFNTIALADGFRRIVLSRKR
jgi:GxxExxY protein